MKSLVEIKCRLQGDGAGSLTIRIAPPGKTKDGKDYFCRITSSPEAVFRLDVFGVIPRQAVRLALDMTAARIASILSEQITDELDTSTSAE